MLNDEKLSKWGIFAIMLASSLTIMVGCAITPALPQMGNYYHLDENAALLVTLPALGIVVFSILFGKLIDNYGPYKVCAIGLFFYGVLGISGQYMPTVAAIFIDRFVLGGATAAVMTSSTALIAQFFSGNRLLKMMALQGMAIELGGVVFLSISGVLADYSWQWPFFIYAIAFAALFFLLEFVPYKKNKKLAVELTKTTVKENKKIYGVLVLAFLGMLIFFTAIVTLPLYLQNRAYGTAFTGLFLAAISLVAVVFAGIMPQLVIKIGAKKVLMAAFFCYAVSHALYYIGDSTPLLWAAAIFMGIGFGFSTPLVNNLTVKYSSEADKGRNLGLYSMAVFLGQFMSAFIAGLGKNTPFIITSMTGFVIAVILIAGIVFKKKEKKLIKV